MFTETIRDGLEQANGDWEQDYEEEEEELDEELLVYTEEFRQQRQLQEEGRVRAAQIGQRIDEIIGLNQKLQEMGVAMVDTPVAEEYLTVEQVSPEVLSEALRALSGELELVKAAIRQAEQEQDGRQAAERARQAQALLPELRMLQRILVDNLEVVAPPSPFADGVDGKATLTLEEHAAAMQGIPLEIHAARVAEAQAVEAYQQQAAQQYLERVDGVKRARQLGIQIEEYWRLCRRLDERADTLGLAPLADRSQFIDVARDTLSQQEFDQTSPDVLRLTTEVSDRLAAIQSAKWSVAEIGDLADGALQAFNDLRGMLGAEGPVPDTCADWLVTLKEHARQQRERMAREELEECVRQFYVTHNAGRPEPERPHKTLMTEFANKFNYPIGDWEEYKRIYSSIRRSEMVQEAPPVDGTLPLAQLRRVLPCGNTAGQWYTADQSFSLGDGSPSYDYHLSVAFSLLGPERVRVTRIHASFKRGVEDRKYWWRVNHGTLTFDGVAGGAAAAGAMRTRADALLNRMLRRLNCQ